MRGIAGNSTAAPCTIPLTRPIRPSADCASMRRTTERRRRCVCGVLCTCAYIISTLERERVLRVRIQWTLLPSQAFRRDLRRPSFSILSLSVYLTLSLYVSPYPSLYLSHLASHRGDVVVTTSNIDAACDRSSQPSFSIVPVFVDHLDSIRHQFLTPPPPSHRQAIAVVVTLGPLRCTQIYMYIYIRLWMSSRQSDA